MLDAQAAGGASESGHVSVLDTQWASVQRLTKEDTFLDQLLGLGPGLECMLELVLLNQARQQCLTPPWFALISSCDRCSRSFAACSAGATLSSVTAHPTIPLSHLLPQPKAKQREHAPLRMLRSMRSFLSGRCARFFSSICAVARSMDCLRSAWGLTAAGAGASAAG